MISLLLFFSFLLQKYKFAKVNSPLLVIVRILLIIKIKKQNENSIIDVYNQLYLFPNEIENDEVEKEH